MYTNENYVVEEIVGSRGRGIVREEIAIMFVIHFILEVNKFGW